MDRERLLSKAQQVYEYMVTAPESDWQRNMYNWDWKPGVGLVAAVKYGEVIGQSKEVREYLWRWMQDNRHKAAQQRVINSTAPFAALTEMLRSEPEAVAEWMPLVREHGEWLMHEAPRTKEGGFEHTVTEGVDFPEQLWADTLVVGALFLARLASLTGDEAMAQEAVKQVVVHLQILQDEATGVLFHGFDGLHRSHMSAARWGRANAWVAFGVPEIIAEVKHLAYIPPEVGERYTALVQGLVRLQTANGMWHTVMDRPDFYLETSATAGIAYGFALALRSGLIADAALQAELREAVRKAADAVMIHVDVYGAVHGVSGGTPVMPTVEAYNEVKITPTPYGQALALLLISEQLDSHENEI
ncbi:glycoside hydrolase family 88/105 protein [Paenibacillus radicis (ex Xue et al. 2023)]|uniref:Glycoside hydrolase family 88 protein n=1 Tax=Paenibacillus radicis (ex Xue et al. 2023) TaxID=2972489 RepID=A0ABT1YAM8_9BACL|nr:glycoside hydrolase family 88 protein [Paenibacillus radicis (ex Xue et al. 2023)]MCR8629952.1 glycoside hydrolase family 88 protein [Paenibacillus radicis (ex Xue et al. 2023)]